MQRSPARFHRSWRPGQINLMWLLLLAVAVGIALLVGLLWQGGRSPTGPRSDRPALRLLAAAGLRDAVEPVVADYRREFGVTVEVTYGGSGSLLNQLQVDKFSTPDLFLSADAFHLDRAEQEGLVAERLEVGSNRVVLAVPRDSDARWERLPELWESGAILAVPDPDQAAVGQVLRRVLQTLPGDSASGSQTAWDRLSQLTIDRGVFKPTVPDVATDLRIGSVQAGFVWRSTLEVPPLNEQLRAIELPELAGAVEPIGLGVLTSSLQPTAALQLARYITASDRGLPYFERLGMMPLEDADVWAERPELTFFCGAVNRRAVESVVEQFAEREGVVVNTVYDGCGILTSRMKTIEGQQQSAGFPDFYMACDRYYLDNVAEWFQDDIDVSETQIVIAVPKGTSRVTKLEDVLTPGVRLAVGQPDQCTIGALTRRIFQQAGLYERYLEKQADPAEVVVEKSSSALIVPDVLTGHVDAAICYRTDIRDHLSAVDVIPITQVPSRAIQPLSVARSSAHKQLAKRFYRHVERSGGLFEEVGFQFMMPKARSYLGGASVGGDR
jgi:molybdate transport system substrate-binding protein